MSKEKMLCFYGKFVQTDGQTTVKQFAPDLKMQEHKKEKMPISSIFSFSNNIFDSTKEFV